MGVIGPVFLHVACAVSTCALVGYLLRVRSAELPQCMMSGAAFGLAVPMLLTGLGVDLYIGASSDGLVHAALSGFFSGCVIASWVSLLRIIRR